MILNQYDINFIRLTGIDKLNIIELTQVTL
jgi:hypothetical protein